MKIFNSLTEIKDIENTVIALGNFDGVHKGHQELIRRTVKSAEAAGIQSAVFTFSNHPRNLIGKGETVKNILYWEDKAEIIGEMGIDYLFNIPFTEEILTLSPLAYIDDLLLGKLKMKEAYCGFNYHYGYKAEGNVEILMKESLDKGF
ncbi:MAG: bifunctional riboflavin kinase/FMN adenylyltransferase, partial [Anaerovoracaceae bacterium]